ncbi:hypothetical protein SAMN04487910_1840 [Aquimarina amphilecti]|uniref:Uncharacterized protein n=1 Tax=Aquimarina amphilecti TaxID=1038014 RepID=A0A1H7MU57_AQUAM|nr:hypothetical protein [Aquimarina amphilecti]SEL14215.1 hypothetical protein SAMN04487910_1840 [Aquimarina amphilecti]
MKPIYLLLLLMVTIVSCKKSQPSNEEIEKAFQVVNNEKLWKELEEMVYNDQHYRNQTSNLDINHKDYKTKRDSLEDRRYLNDQENTRRIIEITEKYGFPNSDRTGKPIAPWILFHHAPVEYHEKIKPLIEREYQAKRMDSMTYLMLKWHVNGRQGLPY